MVSTAELAQLPLLHRAVIPPDYLDAMEHMNVRWYMALFDEGAWRFFASFGMDAEYYRARQAGGFALKHFIQYFAEVRVGETVAIRGRVLGRTAKRVHFMLFMVNETTDKLAATLEALGSHADMRIRRTAPYPDNLAARLDALIAEQSVLTWDAPVCGIIAP
ncbi:MAG: thioesterase family protein [Anaerolineae bacterium]|nr:thioesterase family protein [Anaerolineae bacterium]